jgi:hypothetical protein
MDRDNKVELLVSEADLVVISNAINEVLHGIDVPEFHTRLGVSEDEARGLMMRVRALLAERFPGPG